MRKTFLIGAIGGTFGIFAGLAVILTSDWNEFMFSGIQAALFSAMGLMGAVISNKEPRFAGWMLLSSAVWILITAPIAGTLTILYLYAPAIILLAIAGIMALREPEPEEEGT
jgi:NADH:ubiquinone oxidoreductase subunit 6 (subunit J)